MLPYNEDIGTVTEMEELLADAPISLLLENVRSQINATFCSVNYVNIYSDKLNIIEESVGDDSDLKRLVNTYRNDFFSKILEIINEFFEVRVDIDYNNPSETEDVATELYEFFIVDIRKVLSRFFYNFIQENKKRIVEELDISKPKKDVLTTSVKKTMKGNDIKIISNIYEVVSYISDLEIMNDVFLEHCQADVLYDYDEQGIIAGNICTGLLQFAKEHNLINDIVPDLTIRLKE